MSNEAKVRIGLLGCSFALLVCLVAMYRQGASAKQELAGLSTRVESLVSELAILRERLDQQSQENAATQEMFSRPDMVRRLAYLEAQQSNVTAHIQSSANSSQSGISYETTLKGQQQALAELKTQVIAQEQKAAATKAKLEDWRRSLDVSDEMVVLEASVALKSPGLANYWPYFEAKRELEEAIDLTQLLKRKLQIEEFDLTLESARANGMAK